MFTTPQFVILAVPELIQGPGLVGATWTTVVSSTLQDNNATAAMLRCSIAFGTDSGDNTMNIRPTGSGLGLGAQTQVCEVPDTNDVVSYGFRGGRQNDAFTALDASSQFDYYLGRTSISDDGNIYLLGYYR